MKRTYWLKNNNNLVAELHYDESLGLYDMEILEPDLFFDRMDKLYFNDSMVRRWIEARITPAYQGKFDKFLADLNLTGKEEDLSWQIFLRTRGANVKDKSWLAFREDESYEEGSPWYRLLNPDLFPNAVEEVEEWHW